SGYGILNESHEAVTRLINELGLRDDVLEARSVAKRRFLAIDGRLQRLPVSPANAITSGYLPFGMRMRMPFGRFRKRRPLADDTIADLLERSLGPRAVDLIADPLAQAFWAADSRSVLARRAMPSLFAQIDKKQSLMRGIASYW